MSNDKIIVTLSFQKEITEQWYIVEFPGPKGQIGNDMQFFCATREPDKALQRAELFCEKVRTKQIPEKTETVIKIIEGNAVRRFYDQRTLNAVLDVINAEGAGGLVLWLQDELDHLTRKNDPDGH